MNYFHKFTLLFMIVFLPIMADTVMKITLSNSVSEESLGTFSKIIFTNDQMSAGSTYDLDDIKKIEFYEGAVDIKSNLKPTSLHRSNMININHVGHEITLSLMKDTSIKATLYSINGKAVIVLYNGHAKQGIVDLNFREANIASGMYSMMVKSGNELFVKKIVVK